MNLFDCPAPSALGAIPATSCPFRMDQIVKLAFQRKQSAAPFANEAALQTQSNWTTLLAASDATKIIVSPFTNNVVVPPSEALTEGGNDNTTIGGVTRLMGGGNIVVTGEIRNISNSAWEALRKLSSESAITAGFTNLTAFFFNKDGKIIHNSLSGFEIYNWFIADRGSEGFNKDDVCPFRFEMKYGWSKDLAISTPTFNVLNI